MRPLELRLEGFRSYRTGRTIPLAELDLVAIIGDTGAGKSSLLEAVTWSLYGASTWSKKAHNELLAHGAKRMTVGLIFEASDQRWELVRSFARSGQSAAKLICLTDPTIATVDGVTGVDQRIPEIIGLSYEVFCSCVLLPQGKFERLLKATKAERTDRLKSILRLDQLERVREIAAAHAGRLREREFAIVSARSAFRPDPARDLAAAQNTIEALTPERERMEQVLSELVALDLESAASAEQARTATATAERLRSHRGDWAAQLRDLAETSSRLVPALEKLAAESVRAIERLEGLNDRQRQLRAEGMDGAGLAAHRERLDRLVDVLANRASELVSLEKECAALEQRTMDEHAADREAEGTERALANLDQGLGEAEEDLARAKTTFAELDSALKQLAEARQVLELADGSQQEAEATLSSSRTSREAAAEALAEARDRRQRATAERDAVLRADTASHIAGHCHPGDPCPICARTLPEDFVAPVSEGLDVAERRLGEAEVEEERATTAFNAAEVDGRAAEIRLSDARSARERAAAGVAEAQTAVVERGGEESLGRQVELAGDVAGLRKRRDALRAERPLKERSHTMAAKASASAVAARHAQAASVRASEQRLAEIENLITSLVDQLPEMCALPASADLSSADLTSAGAVIAVRQADAEQLERDLHVARSEVGASRDAENAARLEIERQVTSPTARSCDGLLRLAEELSDDLHKRVKDLAAAPTAVELLPLAEEIDGRVEQQLEMLTATAAAAETARASAQKQAAALLASSSYADQNALRSRLDEVRAELLAAEREKRLAERELASAARLDDLLRQAAQLRAGLEELRDALNDGAFVGYVVSRRQRALLAHASRVLEQITDRYAFTDDFQILDRESGLPRSPDTLSGGETFIASLALALGLVEVADRSGGDLRALFLDEGFGTLDATILDTALTALQERARAGRLIGLISHVPTVAERIDTVLEVRSTVSGSEVVLLTGEERDRRVMDHISAATVGV